MLGAACEPATFGRANEDVLDESYLKAGKMYTERFASKFDLELSRILPTVLSHLLIGSSDKEFEAERYKLNVYSMLIFPYSCCQSP